MPRTRAERGARAQTALVSPGSRLQVGALRAAERTSPARRAWPGTPGRAPCGARVLAASPSPGVDLLFIGRLDKGAGGEEGGAGLRLPK